MMVTITSVHITLYISPCVVLFCVIQLDECFSEKCEMYLYYEKKMTEDIKTPNHRGVSVIIFIMTLRVRP